MFKIEGLDKLQKDLSNAKKALEELDGSFGSVSFDPSDPSSIDQAITGMERIIDAKLAGYEDNLILGPLIEELKEKYRAMILEKSAEARLKENG